MQNFIVKVILAVLILFFTSGCSTRSSVMKSWMGNNIDDLTSSWGSPTSIIQRRDGGVTYTWREFYSNQYGVHQCNQTFVTNKDGIITTWSYNGCSRFVK